MKTITQIINENTNTVRINESGIQSWEFPENFFTMIHTKKIFLMFDEDSGTISIWGFNSPKDYIEEYGGLSGDEEVKRQARAFDKLELYDTLKDNHAVHVRVG